MAPLAALAALFALCVELGTAPSNAQPLNPQSGGVKTVTAGSGLSGGGTGAVTLNVGGGSGIVVTADNIAVDETREQRRVSGVCTSGNAIQTINADGSVVCQSAGNTAGSGLALAGSVMSIDPTYTQRRVSGTCASPNSIVSVAQDGTVTCATGTGTVTSVATGSGLTGGPITTTGTLSLNIAGASCAAGTGMSALSATGTGTCTADVTSVVAGTGISTSTTSGAATVTANLAGASCSAGSYMTALSATGTGTCTADPITVSGTSNTLAMFTGTNAVGNSPLTYNGSTTLSTAKLISVSTGTSGAGSPLAGTAISTESATNTYISLLSPGSGNYKAIFFGNTASNIDGGILYDNVSRGMEFRTGGNATRLTIDSSGTATFANNLVSTAGTTTVGQFLGTTISPSVTGSILDWAPTGISTATIIYAVPSAATTIRGITGGAAGRELWLYNNSASFNLTLSHEDGTELTAANRITMTAGINGLSDLVPTCAVHLRYNATTSRWVQDVFSCWHLPGAIFDQSVTANAGTTTTTLTTTSTTLLGNDSADAITFSNGPSGDNLYAGTHLEQADEWCDAASGLATGVPIGSSYVLQFSGAGTGLTTKTISSGRPCVAALTTGTASTGSYASILSDPGAIKLGAGTNYTYEAAVNWPVLSSSSNSIASAYISLIGFFDSPTSSAASSGCFFAYDKANLLTSGPNSGFVDALECWCIDAGGGTVTKYLINNSGNSDESFPLGVGAIVAATYYRLAIVLTGTTRAEFYRNGTKVCDINTHLPTTAFGMGFGQYPRSVSGPGSRSLEVDQTTWKMDIPVRSP